MTLSILMTLGIQCTVYICVAWCNDCMHTYGHQVCNRRNIHAPLTVSGVSVKTHSAGSKWFVV